MDILQQGAFEESKRAGFLQPIDNRNVFPLECVTGFTPLEFFGELRVKKDSSQLLQLFLSLFRVGDKGIDLWIGFARRHGKLCKFPSCVQCKIRSSEPLCS
jgi:hypothetical protein